jgi:hypothetical protein
MSRVSWSFVVLWSLTFAGAPAHGQSPQPQQTAPASESSRGASSQRGAADFAEPQRLLKQGKYDDALSALHDMEEKHPAKRG